MNTKGIVYSVFVHVYKKTFLGFGTNFDGSGTIFDTISFISFLSWKRVFRVLNFAHQKSPIFRSLLAQ